MQGVVYFLGEPGLYKIIDLKQNIIFVEGLDEEKKRLIKQIDHSKVICLDDISVYTQEGTVSIWKFFENARNFMNDKVIEKDILLNKDKLFNLFEQIMPNYDKEKVRQHEAKKILTWFNTLQKSKFFEDSI